MTAFNPKLAVTFLLLALFSAKVFASEISPVENEAGKMLDGIQTYPKWSITNDSVMGGLSLGNVIVNENIVRFFGTLSTENNGGFTSVFSQSLNLSSEVNTVTVLVRGDGKKYQLRMRSEVSGYLIAYKAEFTTKPNSLEKHTFKLSDLKASFRGRDIANAPQLQADSIKEVGFLFTSNQTEDFALSIHSINFSTS
ncbi:CIA30 family protein [Paraglaciecola sp.]|uniref:CIA30 family protein n=1 Tax=Paraglaciecola sp. TaxID=1920173 RepID=UPI003EF4AAC1